MIEEAGYDRRSCHRLFFIKYFYVIKVIHTHGNFHSVGKSRYKENLSMKRDGEKFPSSSDPTSLVLQRESILTTIYCELSRNISTYISMYPKIHFLFLPKWELYSIRPK